MAFEASGMTIPGTEIGPVVTAEIPTKVLCLTDNDKVKYCSNANELVILWMF